jgi:pimeloyl-ACP methyl ester carboxylesterase
MKTYERSEFKMAYEEHGEGNGLLLIHGYPFNQRMWRPQLEGLADVARVITPDLRGHGHSDPVGGIYTMDLLADDCAALMDHLKITQPVVVCGLSMGGYVAMAFCRRFPHRLAGLILTATRAGVDSPETLANRDQTAELVLKEGVSSIAARMLERVMSPKTYQNNPGLVAEVRAIIEMTSVEGVRGALMGMKVRPDSHVTLMNIKVPALVIQGADDQIVPLQEAITMKAFMPEAQLVVIPDAGHLPNLEQPARFNQVVGDFLKKLK